MRLLVTAFCAVLAAGCASPRVESSGGNAERSAGVGAYRLINPLLDCDTGPDRREIRPFRPFLERVAREATSAGRASHVSIYFRDLQNGAWLGVNERESFLPASLLKVPLMMAVLSDEDRMPGVLEERIRVPETAPEGVPQRYGRASELALGSTRTVRELVGAMIADSDNVAMAALVTRFGGEGIRRVYGELGVYTPEDGVPDTLRVKDYAGIFRLLYNASYLSRRSSEWALGQLERSSFGAGLRAGVPREIRIAHKFGERETEDRDMQLHDCGIVYYPGHPYLLCVMTRGSAWLPLEDVIRSASRAVFDEVRRQFPL